MSAHLLLYDGGALEYDYISFSCFSALMLLVGRQKV